MGGHYLEITWVECFKDGTCDLVGFFLSIFEILE